MTALTKEFVIELFQDYREAIVAFLFNRVSCRDTAEDIAQEAFSRMLKLEGRTDVMDGRAFMFRMAANLANDHHDYQQVRARFLEPECEPETVASRAPDLVAVVDMEQQLDRLWAALSTLPARSRRALLLSRFEGLSHTQIAQRLGVSVATVERDINQAMKCCRDASCRDESDV